MSDKPSLGEGDSTFQAAGREEGIFNRVDTFYDLMRDRAPYREIWDMHPGKTPESRDRLARFLCAWTGGPRLYREKYSPISILSAHAHLHIDVRLRDAWLACMAEALDACEYPEIFKTYLLDQLAVPAERIRVACARHQACGRYDDATAFIPFLSKAR